MEETVFTFRWRNLEDRLFYERRYDSLNLVWLGVIGTKADASTSLSSFGLGKFILSYTMRKKIVEVVCL